MAGYYQGPPVMAPPQYYAAPPPRTRQTGFLEGWLVLSSHSLSPLFFQLVILFPYFYHYHEEHKK